MSLFPVNNKAIKNITNKTLIINNDMSKIKNDK